MPRKTKQVSLITKVLDEHKATDIEVIDVREKSPFADYYILCTAGNIRQLDALADVVVEELEKNKFSVNHKEGTPESGWILIDSFDVIVNVFSKEERERIALEEVLTRQ